MGAAVENSGIKPTDRSLICRIHDSGYWYFITSDKIKEKASQFMCNNSNGPATASHLVPAAIMLATGVSHRHVNSIESIRK